MDITLSDFTFNTATITTTTDVDKLIEEYNLQIKGMNARLENREVLLEKAESRSEDLVQDIAEVTADIAAKEKELTGYVAGTPKYESVDINLAKLKIRLRELNHHRETTESTNPINLVERHMDNGEAKLMVEFYKLFLTALEQRKTELGG